MAEQDPIAAMKARWSYIQPYLFPFLREEVDPLTAKLEQLIYVLDTIGLEAYVRAEVGGRGKIGAPSLAPSSPRPSSGCPRRGRSSNASPSMLLCDASADGKGAPKSLPSPRFPGPSRNSPLRG
jgi:hypothetical protein